MLFKNEIYDVRIDGYSSKGEGVGRIDGQVIFIKGAIKGEMCRVKVLKAAKNLAYGKIEEILETSEHRIPVSCPVFGKCGGCDMLHTDYAEELAFKKQRVFDALSRIGGVYPELTVIGAETRTGYRNKAIFNVGIDSGKTIYGFYRKHSHDIIDAKACMIQNDSALRAAEAVRFWMDSYGISAYDEAVRLGCVRRIFCRYGQVIGQLQVSIVTATNELKCKDELVDCIRKACPEVSSITQNVNMTQGNTVMSGDYKLLWGKNKIEDVLCGLEFSLSPASFYQINHNQAEKLYSTAREYAGLTGSETVLDMYCGTGTITLYMARRARYALGVEIVEAAILDAIKNAEKNNIKNAEFICADASQIAERLQHEGTRPDVIIVDPPRKGLAPDVPEYLAKMEPDRIVYVSCDPETLARDVRIFSGLGYHMTRGTVVDMFPCTCHVETVCLLSRKEK